MEKSTKIAVVILNWNGQKLLAEFLPKVVQYSSTEDCEVVVADNASSDVSIPFLEKNYPKVRLIRLPINYGFAEGYNQALKQVRARYYIILNSDVEVTPNWLSPIISAMDDNPNIAAAQPKIKSYHKRSHFEHAGACGGFMDKLGYTFCRGRMLLEVEEDKGQYDETTTIFWATGTAFFIRASVFHSFGGFDSFFHAHMEEIDLCWRINNAGYKIVCVPQSTIYHVGGASLSYDNPRKTYLNFRNSLYMLFKNLPSNTLCQTLAIRSVLDFFAAMMFLLKLDISFFFAVWRAYFIFPFKIRTLRKKRKLAQSMVKSNAKPSIYPKSILWQYYAKKKKKFSDLTF